MKFQKIIGIGPIYDGKNTRIQPVNVTQSQ